MATPFFQPSPPASQETPAGPGSISEVLDTREAATFLCVHVTTLQELARRGEVPCRKVGKDYRFFRDALCHWLQGTVPQRAYRRGFGR